MKKGLGSFNKKLVASFTVLLFSFGIYSFTISRFDDRRVIENNKILVNSINKKTDSNIEKGNNFSNVMDKLIVFPKDSYDKSEVNKMIIRLERIPYPILDKLSKKGIKIILSNTNITEIKEYEHLKGVTPKGWESTGKTWDDVPGAGGNPVVARIGYSNPGEAHGSINLELHETAHAIDAYVFDDVSSSKEFKDIWKREVKSVFGDNPYFVDFPEEYFAETFAMYYLNENEKGGLREEAPLTYKFIENLQYEIEG